MKPAICKTIYVVGWALIIGAFIGGEYYLWRNIATSPSIYYLWRNIATSPSGAVERPTIPAASVEPVPQCLHAVCGERVRAFVCVRWATAFAGSCDMWENIYEHHCACDEWTQAPVDAGIATGGSSP